jgi:hypothetical protein
MPRAAPPLPQIEMSRAGHPGRHAGGDGDHEHKGTGPAEPKPAPRRRAPRTNPEAARYIGQVVRVRTDRTLVRVFLRGDLIKAHPRKQPGQRSTDPGDYPAGKSEYATRSVERLVERAAKRGVHVGRLTERLLDRPLPWTRMRQAHQLDRLCKKYGAERVDVLCARSLEFDVVDVTRIESMLRKATRVEVIAEQAGKLRALPPGRFARPTDAFRTRQEEGV